MKSRHSTRLLGCLLFSYLIFVLLGTVPAAAFSSMSDDFSGDTGNWQYVGDAKRTNGHVELAPARSGAVGIAALKQDVRYPFVVEFRAQTSTSGEGLVFMFHHEKGYTPAAGGRMGAAPSSGSVDGWGVELDVRSSGGSDTGAPHLGLVGDPLGFHFKSDNSVKFNDNKWHSLKIEIQWSTIILSFDGKEVWHFSDYSYKNAKSSGMGFSAASAGGAFRVDDFKLMSPGEAEVMYWITFGVIVGTVVFGTLGGICVWGSLRWRSVYKQYAQPGIDYHAFRIDGNMQKQIISAAGSSPDPDMARLRSGLRMTRVGMGVAGFLMMALIIGTLFMPPMIVLTVGVVLMIVFISLFGIAGALAARRAKPFIVLMGQRLGWIPPGPYSGPIAAPPMQPVPAYMAPPQQQWQAPPQTQTPWQPPPPVQQPGPWQAPPQTQTPWQPPPPVQQPGPWQAPPQTQTPWQPPPPVQQPGPWQAPPQPTPLQAPPPVPPASPQIDWGAPAAPPARQSPPDQPGYQPPPYPGVGNQPYRPARPPGQ